LTKHGRWAVDDYIKAAGKKPGEFLFSGRSDHNRSTPTQQYARLDQSDTRPSSNRQLTCRATAVGHTKIESAVRYLGIELDDALAIAEQIDV
jgi:hypothetical protein